MVLEHVPLLDHGVMDAEQRSKGTPEVATSGSQTGPFFLSEVFAPVPAKLVMNIQALEFVEMAHLLPDNIEMRRLEEVSSQGEAVMAVGRRARQVTHLVRRGAGSIVTWLVGDIGM